MVSDRRVATLVCASLAFAAAPARADCDPRGGASTCLTSDALWPMPGEQRFGYVASPELTAPGRFGAALVTSYQKRPIQLHVGTPGPKGADTFAVDDQIDTTLVASFGIIETLGAYVALPSTVYQSGVGSSAVTGRAAPSSSSIRDPRAGIAVALVSRPSTHVTAFGDVQAPLRSTTDFAGEKGFVFSPTVASDFRFAERFVVGAALGARFRPAPQTFFGERQGTQALFGVGCAADLLPRELLSVGTEARAIAGFDGHSDVRQGIFGTTNENTRTLIGGEWLATLRTSMLANRLTVLAGGGTTLPFAALIGIGEMRFLLALSYTSRSVPASRPATEEAAPPPEQPIAPPPPPGPRPAAPPPPAPNQCVATCKADSFSPLPQKDEGVLAEQAKAPLMDLRTCLVRVGAERIRPAILLRFTEQGAILDVRIDVGGYEDLECIKETRPRMPAFAVSRGTTARCELRCGG